MKSREEILDRSLHDIEVDSLIYMVWKSQSQIINQNQTISKLSSNLITIVVPNVSRFK